MIKRPLPIMIVAVLAACTSAADGPVVEGDAIGNEGAHEHGIIRMGLAVDGTDIQLDMQAPGDAAFGFEHVPETDEDIATVVSALELLTTQTANALAFASDLTCQASEVVFLEAPDVEGHGHDDDESHPHDEDEEGHGHDEDDDHGHDGDEAHEDDEDQEGHEGEDDHDHEAGSQHSEVRLTMSWSCNASPEGTEATLQVEQLFADVHNVDLTVITSMGQAGARVDADATFQF